MTSILDLIKGVCKVGCWYRDDTAPCHINNCSKGTELERLGINMTLSDIWNNTYNSQLVLIRLNENEIFEGVMGDVPIEFMNYHVIWIKSVEDRLIIDILII